MKGNTFIRMQYIYQTECRVGSRKYLKLGLIIYISLKAVPPQLRPLRFIYKIHKKIYEFYETRLNYFYSSKGFTTHVGTFTEKNKNYKLY